jgi:hypothetical protein
LSPTTASVVGNPVTPPDAADDLPVDDSGETGERERERKGGSKSENASVEARVKEGVSKSERGSE